MKTNKVEQFTPAVKSEKVERFVRLLTANNQAIYAFILGLVPNRSDADDIMQEATVVMWRKFDQFIPETDFVAWGVAIARNLVLNFRKKKKPVYLADEALQLLDMESDILLKDQNLRLDALKKCVKKLQPKDRSLVHLRYTENVCVRSIARRFGQHQRSIYKNLARIQDGLLRCVNRTLREIVT